MRLRRRADNNLKLLELIIVLGLVYALFCSQAGGWYELEALRLASCLSHLVSVVKPSLFIHVYIYITLRVTCQTVEMRF
jgi:hypothetical protein